MQSDMIAIVSIHKATSSAMLAYLNGRHVKNPTKNNTKQKRSVLIVSNHDTAAIIEVAHA